MKVLFLGWEFPPALSGGLGVVTKALFQSLQKVGVDITLALPTFVAEQLEKVEHLPLKKEGNTFFVPSCMQNPYALGQKHMQFNEFGEKKDEKAKKTLYGDQLWEEIHRFASQVVEAATDDFDIVHAQDWVTAEAAIQLKTQKGIPFFYHCHATQIDRTGDFYVNDEISRREKHAMQEAVHIFAVSGYTKRLLVERYGISAEKISVVYNAYQKQKFPYDQLKKHWPKDQTQFWVLFIGRLTLQKGPDYFLEMAKKVLSVDKNFHFYIAGEGDMKAELQTYAKNEGISKNIHFTGFLNAEKRNALYIKSDACVIPSVSEPFGLTALEAAAHRTPLVISKTCGAAEVVGHKLLTDFWDTEKMASYILGLKNHPELRRTLRQHAKFTLPETTWLDIAIQIRNLYKKHGK